MADAFVFDEFLTFLKRDQEDSRNFPGYVKSALKCLELMWSDFRMLKKEKKIYLIEQTITWITNREDKFVFKKEKYEEKIGNQYVSVYLYMAISFALESRTSSIQQIQR
mgnify:CR=1 FL=1